MSKYSEAIAKDPPRLVVSYKRGETRAKDESMWGHKGTIPTTHLVGMIVRIQAELQFRAPDEADDVCLVVCYDEKEDKFEWFVHKSIPADWLIGTLENVKQLLVAKHLNDMMQHAQKAQQTGLVNPDGRPITRRQ